jgi:hypothetical protein
VSERKSRFSKKSAKKHGIFFQNLTDKVKNASFPELTTR